MSAPPARLERSRSIRTVLALLVTALVATAMVVGAPGAAHAGPPAGPADIAGGTADWGVKASFRSYIATIGAGTVTVDAPATTNGDGTFRFPNATGTWDGGTAHAAYGGSIHFVGHQGALDMTISAVRVELDGATGALRADVVSRSSDTGELVTFDDVAFADLNPTGITPGESGSTYTWADVPATLTADGSAALAGFYPAGTALDPVTLAFTFGEPSPTQPAPPTIDPPVAPTPTPTEPVDPQGERSVTGPTGQTLTVTPVDGLDPNGQIVQVTGAGYDESIGIYVGLCVDRGPNLAPSPCLGGVDMSGGSGASVWISSNPPPYGLGVARPFDAGGSFSATVNISAVDTDDQGNVIADCFDPDTRCVVASRADHTNPGVLSADVKVPVYFAGQTVPDDDATVQPWVSVQQTSVRPGDPIDVAGGGFLAGEQVEVWLHSDPQWIATATADPSGSIAYRFTLPLDTPAGSHAVELRSMSGVSVTSASFTVVGVATEATARTTAGTLPATGADGRSLVTLGLVLVGAGATLALVARRRADEASPR